MIALCALVAGCASPLAGAADSPVAIRRSEYLAVDGAKLFLMTRGADRRSPVVLWLHGGPGGPERPLFRYFNGELENRFVVAYWDQRGAGRSFDEQADPRSLTVARHLDDLDAVVDHLRQTLGQDRVVLIGHSWGSALGMLYLRRHPEKVSAFIGVAPLVSLLKSQQAEYEFVRTEAARRKDDSTLARLREIGPPPHASADRQLKMEDLADRYGAVFHRKPCKTCVVVRGLLGGLVTPWELVSVHRGVQASLTAMTPELLDLDLQRSVPSVDGPVFFFLGRHDRHVDASIGAAYSGTLRAPVNRVVWFENAAHNVPFEEPGLFNATVVDALQSIGVGPETGAEREDGMRIELPNNAPKNKQVRHQPSR
jgi:pimeloyl-ACP methyl ester carboxylesterase